MEVADERRVGSPALPGCAIGGKARTNAPRDVFGVFVLAFPPIVPAAKGGAQPCAFMDLYVFTNFMLKALVHICFHEAGHG